MVNHLPRVLRHLATTRRAMRAAFGESTLAAIERAVHDGESLHSGELRFAVETDRDLSALFAGETPRERALEVFSMLRVWDTEANNGVLVYVLFADRDIEIVADRGFRDRVPEADWRAICDSMRGQFARGEFEAGALAGVAAVHEVIARHFPAGPVIHDELPDRPALL